MNKEQKLLPLIEALSNSMMVGAAYSEEIALLIVWKHLVETKPELSLPTPKDVIDGVISFKDAYSNISEVLVSLGDGYQNENKLEESTLDIWFSEQGSKDLLLILENIDVTDIYDLIRRLFVLASTEGVSKAHFVLPDEIIQLMTKLAKLEESDVYTPFNGSIQLAVEAMQQGSRAIFEAEVASPLINATVLMTDMEYYKSDPLFFPLVTEDGSIRQFPNVIMAPPFGRRIKDRMQGQGSRFDNKNTNGDVLALEHGLSQCSGRLVALVPQGFLFRGAFDYDLRAKLINNGLIEAVIQLPTPTLSFAGIATAIIVIDKNRDPEAPVIFYDADQQKLSGSAERGRPRILSGWKQVADDLLNRNDSPFCAYATKDMILQNKCDLSARRYVLGKATAAIRSLGNTKPLAEVSDLIRGQLLKEEKNPQGEVFVEVGVRDIGENDVIALPKRRLELSGRMQDRAKLQRLQPGDILLVTKGSVGKIGFVGENCAANWVASQSFQVVRLKHARYIESPAYLFHYLSSPLVKAYLSEQVTGTTIPMLKTGDIKELPVPIMPIDEQNEIVNTEHAILDAYNKIHEINNKIELMRDKHWSLNGAEL